MDSWLTIVPQSGLCNRMRAIASAYNLAKTSSRKLKVIWKVNKNLGADYYDLFLPSNCFKVETLFPNDSKKLSKKLRSYKYQPVSQYQKWIQEYFFDLILTSLPPNSGDNKTSTYLEEKIKAKRSVLIYSNLPFYQKHNLDFSLFNLIPKLSEQVEEIVSKFTVNTIGIHIRRTDNIKSIKYSPLEEFNKAIEKEINDNPKVNFFLATDCKETTSALIDRFSDRIFTRNNNLSRESIQGIQDAAIDLYALSRTTKILGSYWSSFSRTASRIGGIPRITITNDPNLKF